MEADTPSIVDSSGGIVASPLLSSASMMAHHCIPECFAWLHDPDSSFHCCKISSAKCLPHFISNVLCNRCGNFLVAFFDYFVAVKTDWENRNGCVDD